MTYRLAVFDMAGTTVSNSDLVVDALVQTLKAHGHSARPEQARALMGYPKPQAIRILLGENSAAAADVALVERMHREFVVGMVESYRNDPAVASMPAAEDCLAVLRARGIKVALNTAFSRDIAQVIVDRFGWLERGVIDDLIATDEVAAGRPAPDMIRALMARHGVADSKQVLKVGDTEVDIKEGRNAGCGLVVAVTTGAYDRATLQAYAPDHILDSLAQLPPLL
jgi:phosphonatase-like hydrolase